MDELREEYLDLVRYSDMIFRKDFVTNKGCEAIKIFLKTDCTLSIVTMVNGIVVEIKTIL